MRRSSLLPAAALAAGTLASALIPSIASANPLAFGLLSRGAVGVNVARGGTAIIRSAPRYYYSVPLYAAPYAGSAYAQPYSSRTCTSAWENGRLFLYC